MRTQAPRSEWASGWLLLLGCFTGIAAPLLSRYTIGQFMIPMQAELGWSRTQITLGLTLSALVAFISAPVVGRFADRLNVRIFALVGVSLIATAFTCFSFVGGSVTVWVLLWFMQAIGSALVEPVIWLTVISTKFVKHRSLATAIVLSGNSMTLALTPSLAQMLIEGFGWRLAFRLLAICWFGTALLIIYFFFVDTREETAADQRHAHGQGQSEAILPLLLSGKFTRFALAICAIFCIESAYLVHLAPALVDKGFTGLSAAHLVGLSGISAIAGKLIAGWLFDRVRLGTVAGSFLALLAVASALFPLFGTHTLWATAICTAIGLTIGAMYTLSACVTRQVFGQARFGFVFGTLTSVMVLASASGPLIASLVRDRFGSYDGIYWAGIGVATVSFIILKSLESQSINSRDAPAPA